MANLGEYDPFIERRVKNPMSDIETFIHLAKGSLSIGLFAMPTAFKHFGLWAGVGGTAFIGFICTYCMIMLVQASQTLCYRCRVPNLTYAETIEQAFLNDPKQMNKIATVMRCFVNCMLFLNLLAYVCILLVNAAGSIQLITDVYFQNTGLNKRYWIPILGVPMLLLCLIRHLEYLVPFSLAANIFIIFALIVTFSFIFMDVPMDLEKQKEERPPAISSNFQMWPIFFGISVFALQCIGIVLPCEKIMRTPKHLAHCPCILMAAMSVVVTLNGVLGFFGYFKYGKAIEANITSNLPIENLWVQAAKLMLVLANCFTILLQIYVPIQIIWGKVKPHVRPKLRSITQNLIRILLMLLCIGIAYIFPNLEILIALIGSVCFTTLALIMPAIVDLIVFRTDPGYGWLKLHFIKNIFIITFGFFGLLTGSVQSFRNIY